LDCVANALDNVPTRECPDVVEVTWLFFKTHLTRISGF
jgi:hypothetical protein